MKKATYATIGLAAAAAVLAQSGASTLLDTATKAVNGATALKATCSVQTINGASSNVTVDLAKPDLAKIDSPARLVVADGSNITIYDKSAKTYYKQPETPQLLNKALMDAGVGIWAAFFNAKANAGVSNVRVLAGVTRHGIDLTPVQFNKEGVQPTTITLFLASDNIPRQAEIHVKDAQSDVTTVINAFGLTTSNTVNAKQYAFNAPAGSRELSADEVNSAKWYTNFNEALSVAKASNRLVLVDFYTGWCHWCKVLRAEVYPKDEFKAMGKYFVFCEIDAEAEVSLASRYKVNAYPTSVFVDGDGNEVHRLEGYKPLDGYLAEMNAARQAAGK